MQSDLLLGVSRWTFIPTAVEKSFKTWATSWEKFSIVMFSVPTREIRLVTGTWIGSIDITAGHVDAREGLETNELFENYVGSEGWGLKSRDLEQENRCRVREHAFRFV